MTTARVHAEAMCPFNWSLDEREFLFQVRDITFKVNWLILTISVSVFLRVIVGEMA